MARRNGSTPRWLCCRPLCIWTPNGVGHVLATIVIRLHFTGIQVYQSVPFLSWPVCKPPWAGRVMRKSVGLASYYTIASAVHTGPELITLDTEYQQKAGEDLKLAQRRYHAGYDQQFCFASVFWIGAYAYLDTKHLLGSIEERFCCGGPI